MTNEDARLYQRVEDILNDYFHAMDDKNSEDAFDLRGRIESALEESRNKGICTTR
jgi:hypothetical protein